MEFSGNILRIKNKIYAIDNINSVDYSEEILTLKNITFPIMFILTIMIVFFGINSFMIISYIILIGLSFVKRTRYFVFIDNRFKSAYSTFDEDDFLAFKKNLDYAMQNKKQPIKKEEELEQFSESVEEYKIRKRKEAFKKNLKKQEEIYKNKHKEIRIEDIETPNVKEKEELKSGMSNKKKKEKGDDYEKKVAGYYKLDGYDIYLNGIKKDRLDGGIDVICKKDDEVILIQCKNWNHTTGRKITHTHIKEFHSNCIKYIDQENLDKSNVKLKYIVPNKKVFKACAINIFRDDYYNCTYEILEF
ncbi:restriction endonuclease [Poseidonibacter lekithochrous]|uniref:restriction endonuclease n=1 Tax=Poseidonibacter TaxID=2321187 RepID=UPI001C0A2365|nr:MULTISPECIES: restriction endonuclease [Poseidonibacter]MBU3014834.1 restriction endonuclease [Poseidonibacter lekithochrous]MDO6828132.1 restriction endonuclease [Poseidonibacter sp. 1_MG-2023]